MTWRMLKGKRNDGSIALELSLPGVDITTANKLQKAFTSDALTARKVIGGITYIDPVAGWNGGDAGTTGADVNGANVAVRTISYGRTVNPAPDIIAVASASDWTLPLYTNRPQLGYLAGQWHTYIYETVQTGIQDNVYGGNVRRNSIDSVQNGYVSVNWCSARFVVYGFTDRLEFHTNCRSQLAVKYLVLEAPT